MRWFLGILGVLILCAAAVPAWVWLASEAHLRSFAAPPAFAAPIPSDPASLARGKHIALTRGCGGCHGLHLQGEVFHEGDWGERAVGPNLAALARRESAAMLEQAIRHGIGHDGKALYSMPSYNFIRLTDGDLAALIGYLRTVPVEERPLPRAGLGWRIRWDLATGKDAAIPAFVPKVPPLTWQGDPDPAVRRGEYLAMTSCNECHGFSLRGDDPWSEPGQDPPDLAMVASYDRDDFARLMRTGKAAGDRELRLMSSVARGRFSHWTDQEVDDLYAFLSAMGKNAAEAPARP